MVLIYSYAQLGVLDKGTMTLLLLVRSVYEKDGVGKCSKDDVLDFATYPSSCESATAFSLKSSCFSQYMIVSDSCAHVSRPGVI